MKGRRNMPLADWALSPSKGGYSKEEREKIKSSPGGASWVYTGIGAPTITPPSSQTITGTSGRGGRATASAAPNPYAEYMSILEQQRAAAQAARDAAADAARRAQQGQYDANVKKLNTAANDALQQAYINYMMSKRDLPQQLAAQGLSGGAAESTWAGLYNGYGNSRAGTERSRLENLAALQQTLQSNLAQIEQQRLSGDQAALRDYYADLKSLAARNLQNQVNLQQGGGAVDSGANLMMQRARALLQNGGTANDVVQELRAQGADEAQTRWLLQMMGLA